MSEVRVPSKMIVQSYRDKTAGDLEAFTRMKLIGSRVEAKRFAKLTKVSYKTITRMIKRMEGKRWIGFDGRYIFCRSWSRLKFKRRFGLYLPDSRKLTDKLFVFALKTVTRREVRAQKRERAMPKDLPVRYYCRALGISERDYFRKVKSAEKRRLLKRIANPPTKIGKASELSSLRKHLPGVPVFRAGNSAVVPQSSTLKFLI